MADRETWASSADPGVNFKTSTDEIVRAGFDRRRPMLPLAGDRIRLMTTAQVDILDRETKGGARVLEPPSSKSGEERSLGQGDLPDLVLPIGAALEVKAIDISVPLPHESEARKVWARVSRYLDDQPADFERRKGHWPW